MRGLVGELAGKHRHAVSALGNEAAQRAYEKAGFRVVEERKDPAFEALLGAAGFARLTVAL